jgi:type I restriction enzyme S subunit
MSFPRYPAYKDSGVEWLGEVPEHWDVIEARREIAFLTSGSRGWAEYYSDEGPVFLRIGNLTRDSIHIDLEDIQRVNPPPGVEGDRTQVSSGDVLFSITAYLGSVAVVPQGLEKAYVSQHVCLARLTGRRLLPEWLAYSVLSSTGKAYLESESYGGTKVQLSLDDIKSFPLPLPPLDEQRALTSLLDRETAKIDALIAEQQRLIELLQEKRQAVISHAVTKGLNPDAPMKDSGVEWLGEVPEHWGVCRVKAVSVFTTSGPRGWSERVGDVGALFVQSGDLTDVMGIDFANCKRVQVGDDAEAARTKLLDGDLVVCITGAKTGNVAVCENVPESSYVNQHLCLIRPDEGVHPRFLGALLKSSCGQTYFSLAQYGLKQGLSLEDVREAPVALPPLDEQDRICQWLSGVSSHYLPLEAESQSTISLLQERRSALISAAVTGQIDVRGLVAEASDA